MEDNNSDALNFFFKKVTSLNKLIEKQENEPKLKIGCKILNDFLMDGFRKGQIIELVGESGSGKSNFCLQLALMNSIPNEFGGLFQNSLYVTTGKPASEKRLINILEKRFPKLKKISNLIIEKIHFKHLSFGEFQLLMTNLDDYITENQIKMLVIDSFNSLTLEFINDETNETDFKKRAEFIREQLNIIRNIVTKNELFCFLTNEVRDNFGTHSESKPALGNIWENMMSTRLFLHRNKKDYMNSEKKLEERKIEVKFSTRFFDFSEIKFVIKEDGISGILDQVNSFPSKKIKYNNL